jgi:predicted GIY-YIG superfamily endonuclease
MADPILPETGSEPTSVYKYYDRHKILIYVGVTQQGMGRNRQHNADKDWWMHVAEQEVEHLPSRDLALARERELIKRFRPPFNRQHNTGHEAFRRTYLAMHQLIERPPVKPPTYARGIWLVLSTERDSSGRLVLFSDFKDVAVAAKLIRMECRVYYNGHRCGQVHSIEPGPIARIVLGSPHLKDRRIESVWMGVKMFVEKGGVSHFKPKSVAIVGEKGYRGCR